MTYIIKSAYQNAALVAKWQGGKVTTRVEDRATLPLSHFATSVIVIGAIRLSAPGPPGALRRGTVGRPHWLPECPGLRTPPVWPFGSESGSGAGDVYASGRPNSAATENPGSIPALLGEIPVSLQQTQSPTGLRRPHAQLRPPEGPIQRIKGIAVIRPALSHLGQPVIGAVIPGHCIRNVMKEECQGGQERPRHPYTDAIPCQGGARTPPFSPQHTGHRVLLSGGGVLRDRRRFPWDSPLAPDLVPHLDRTNLAHGGGEARFGSIKVSACEAASWATRLALACDAAVPHTS